MQYGHFDDANKEYVITRPDTPRSWSNYLGTTEYGAIITNNAGGYSFYKSAAQGRFIRMRFNSIPMDMPGRLLYLRDMDSGDYWSGSWCPVCKPLDEFKSTCRHGTGYTVIDSEYKDIRTETTYFVPEDSNYECWAVKVENKGNAPRKLRLFSFVEYACNWNALDDLTNLQYVQYIASMEYKNGMIQHGTNVMLPPEPENFQEKDQGRWTFKGVLDAEPTGWDTDRDVFIGKYRSFHNPEVVERGECKNSVAVSDNPCGTLQFDLELAPGETKEFTIVLGIGKADEEGKAALAKLGSTANVRAELEKVKAYWHKKFDAFRVETPDPAVNSMLNMWSQYNALMTFTWSRAASLVYAGERDGLGYRDTVQDFVGVMHNVTQEARERLELMITGQASTGGAMPVVKQFAHTPGKEKAPDESAYRSDDCLWLFNSVQAYVKETGDTAFYEKELPYADNGEATVLGHLRRAIEFNLERTGMHNLPCGLFADWNDCLELGHNGESVFVTMQLRYGLAVYIEACEMLGKDAEADWAKPLLAQVDKHLDEYCWDGEWYVRAFKDDGAVFGSSKNDEGKIFLNPQSWSVLSGHASDEKARKAMDAVKKELYTEYGIMVCAPPFHKTSHRIVKASYMNKGNKENAGIFSHTQGWAVMAEATLGNGQRAYDYFKASLPAAYNDRAELREIEPYVNCQSTHSKFSPRYGASRLPWLSGSATWSFYSASQYLLGIRPDYDGLIVDPAVTADWKSFKVSRLFRGKMVNITVDNSAGVEKGIKKLTLNGEELEGNLLPADKLKETNEVIAVMG